jgi:hypothetical protein
MEARVDVRKLQILNDRINQTLDALNQVRLSVHGLGHTSGSGGANPFGPQGQTLGYQGGVGQSGWNQQQAFGQQGFGQQPFGMPGMGGQQGWLGHTGQTTTQNPFAQYLGLQGLQGQQPYFGQQQNPFLGGLSHSGPEIVEQRILEQRASDPQRLLQTFPFAFGLSPFANIQY